jgi:hypothetical protein
MEPKGSLSCLRQPSYSPYHEPDQSSPYHPILSKIHLSIIHPYLGLPSGLFPSDFPTKILHPFLFVHIRATCPAHHILLELIKLIILGEEHKLSKSQ